VTRAANAAAERAALECPYPGLPPFQEEDAGIFFGREAHVDELLTRLNSQLRFLAVVGPSGGGKSSLVRAGLLPAVRDGMLGDSGFDWRMVILRPGGDPLRALLDAVLTLKPEGDPSAPATVERLAFAQAEIDSRASDGLANAMAHLTQGSQSNLLVVVDQFEELFRLGRRRGDERTWWERSNVFVQQLLAAAEQTRVPIYVVITMRTEFIGDCAAFHGLADALNAGQYLVPRLTQRQLRNAIVLPLQQRGQSMAPMLVERILGDSVRVQDELPVLQHALMRTWLAWQHDSHANEIGVKHYESAGTVDSALDRHAEEIYGSFSPTEQHITEVLFRRLSRKTEQVVTRSPTSLRRLASVVGVESDDRSLLTVISAFAAAECRILHTGREWLAPDVEIDISHEAVLRVWKRARSWIADEGTRAATYAAILGAALQYDKGEIGPWRHPQLGLTLGWWKQVKPTAAWAGRYHPRPTTDTPITDEQIAQEDADLFGRALRFLSQSEVAADAERDAEMALAVHSRQSTLYRYGFTIATLLLLIIAVLFASVTRQAWELDDERTKALSSANEARSERVRAEIARNEAEAQKLRAESRTDELAKSEALLLEKTGRAEEERQRAEKARTLADEAADEARAAETKARKAMNDLTQETRKLQREQRRLQNAIEELKRQNSKLVVNGAAVYACKAQLRRCSGNQSTLEKELASSTAKLRKCELSLPAK